MSEGIYSVSRHIRFGDSDPAGIVFYVAFFRMFNDLFESWIGDRLGIDFAREFFDEGRMFPLVHCDVDFKKARRMGDNLDLALILTGIGRSSIRYVIVGSDRGRGDPARRIRHLRRFQGDGPVGPDPGLSSRADDRVSRAVPASRRGRARMTSAGHSKRALPL